MIKKEAPASLEGRRLGAGSSVSVDRLFEETERWLGLKVMGPLASLASPAMLARMIWKHRLAVGRSVGSTLRHACLHQGHPVDAVCPFDRGGQSAQ